jgi:hypothetical protein
MLSRGFSLLNLGFWVGVATLRVGFQKPYCMLSPGFSLINLGFWVATTKKGVATLGVGFSKPCLCYPEFSLGFIWDHVSASLRWASVFQNRILSRCFSWLNLEFWVVAMLDVGFPESCALSRSFSWLKLESSVGLAKTFVATLGVVCSKIVSHVVLGYLVPQFGVASRLCNDRRRDAWRRFSKIV